MTQYWITQIHSLLLFTMTIFRNSIQDGMTLHFLRQRSHLMTSCKSLYKLRMLESDQFKTVLEVYDMEIHQKMSVPNYQKLKTMVKRSVDQKTSIAKLWRQACAKWNRSSDQESRWIKWRWRRQRYLLPVERWRPMFERRPVQFPAWEWRSCTKTDTECRHAYWAINDTRSKWGQERSNPGVIFRQPCRCYLKGTCTRSPCECWHPPKCQFSKKRIGMQSKEWVFVPTSKGWRTTK